MSTELPPDWAIEKALKLSEWRIPLGLEHFKGQLMQGQWPTLVFFARYIAEHEDAPVDPCVVEGRKLVAETQHDWPESPWHVGEAAETIAGNRDYTLVVKAAIEGVRRGIELGKSS